MDQLLQQSSPELDLERTTESPPPGIAGKSTLTSRLSAPPVVFRVTDPETARVFGEALAGHARVARAAAQSVGLRDANGVAADAEHAVARAASSSGAPLPTHVQRQFEGSLGADLSAVRVHTGGASAEAAHAVGARAYTVGQDIHFADGQFRPDDPFGMHLLAHEVAHTVQQAGGAQRRQHKLEVSTPHDALEVEADRAADAMVSGAPAHIAGAPVDLARKVRRGPNNSYSKGAGLTWEGNTALTEEENKQWAEKQGAFAQKAAGFAAKKLGLDTGAVIKKAKARVDTEIEIRQQSVGHLDTEIKNAKKQGKDVSELQKQRDKDQRELEGLKGSRDDVITKATEMANKANETVKSLASVGEKVVSLSGGKIETTMFKSMSDVTAKIENYAKLVEAAHQIYDTDAALKAFQAEPTFDTAAAWGNTVAKSLSMCSSLVSGLPAGWGSVISGVLQMPQVLIPAFISISKSYYARLDAATKEGTGKGKILKDGETG